MFSPSKFKFDLHRLTGMGTLVAIALSAAPFCQAQLMFEQHQGGPLEYRQVSGFNHAADFHLTEAIQIQAITGWFAGGFYGEDQSGGFDFGPGIIAVSISDSGPFGIMSIYSPTGPIDYFKTFQLAPSVNPPPGQKTPPGQWGGAGSLRWVLGPGDYSVNFFGASMPLTYGYSGPLSNVSGFDAFNSDFYHTTEVMDQSAFGVRIYGRPLSAIPEPSSYGIASILLLLAAIVGSKRRQATRPFPEGTLSTDGQAGARRCFAPS